MQKVLADVTWWQALFAFLGTALTVLAGIQLKRRSEQSDPQDARERDYREEARHLRAVLRRVHRKIGDVLPLVSGDNSVLGFAIRGLASEIDPEDLDDE